jgi:hypothetical protein
LTSTANWYTKVVLEKSDVADIYRKVKSERRATLVRSQELDRQLRAYDRVLDGYLQLFPELAQETEDDTEAESPHEFVRTLRPPPSRNHPPSPLIRRQRLRSIPRGQDAILSIMEESEFRNRRWTALEMAEELDKRGWTPKSDDPVNAVRASLNRLRTTHPNVRRSRNGEEGTMRYWYSSRAREAETITGQDSGSLET